MYQIISETYAGKHQTELPTPALLLDLDILDFNLKTMMDSVKGTNTAVRPHMKAHKCPAIAHRQIDAGAIGITCAKLGEAEVMVNTGIKSILLANQVIGEGKIRVLAGLNRYAEVMPAIDSKENAKNISDIAKEIGVNIPVCIEVDNGLNRSGVRTVEEGVELAEFITGLPNMTFKGIQAYEGAFRGKTWDEKQTIVDKNIGHAAAVKNAIQAAGIPVEILSCASTGTWKLTAEFESVTEIQPGSYALMETAYYGGGVDFPFKQALSVICTVCSAYTNRLVLDAGKKTVTIDQGIPTLIEDPDATLTFHEEHCLIDTTDKLRGYKVGDKMSLSPSHCCTTANQHDFYYCVRGGVVEAIWPILARSRYE